MNDKMVAKKIIFPTCFLCHLIMHIANLKKGISIFLYVLLSLLDVPCDSSIFTSDGSLDERGSSSFMLFLINLINDFTRKDNVIFN